MKLKLKAHDGADIMIEVDDCGHMNLEIETFEGHVDFWIPKDGVLELRDFINGYINEYI